MATRRRLKMPKAVLEVFRRLGAEGGHARAKNLTAAERRASAQAAGVARWKGVSAAERRAFGRKVAAARRQRRRAG